MGEDKVYSWRELAGNKFNRRINLNQIYLDNGEIIATNALLLSEPRIKRDYPILVRYDREYALEYLRKTVLDPLQGMPLEKILELLKDAYLNG